MPFLLGKNRRLFRKNTNGCVFMPFKVGDAESQLFLTILLKAGNEFTVFSHDALHYIYLIKIPN
jgi:hypothetical protein